MAALAGHGTRDQVLPRKFCLLGHMLTSHSIAALASKNLVRRYWRPHPALSMEHATLKSEKQIYGNGTNNLINFVQRASGYTTNTRQVAGLHRLLLSRRPYRFSY